MAVPKKKSSKSRRNMRRFSSSNRLQIVTISNCPDCQEPRRPHRVCSCGRYAGETVFTAAAKPAPVSN